MVGEREIGKEAIRNIIKWRYENLGIRPGKMFIQKMLFISKWLGEDIEYDFSLYTYGPFSSKIMNDLDEMEEMGEISIEWNDQFEGYEIYDKRIERDENINFRILNDVLQHHGNKNAKQLELMSTILFLRNDVSEEDLHSAVKKVKPLFNDNQIYDMISLTEEMQPL